MPGRELDRDEAVVVIPPRRGHGAASFTAVPTAVNDQSGTSASHDGSRTSARAVTTRPESSQRTSTPDRSVGPTRPSSTSAARGRAVGGRGIDARTGARRFVDRRAHRATRVQVDDDVRDHHEHHEHERGRERVLDRRHAGVAGQLMS